MRFEPWVLLLSRFALQAWPRHNPERYSAAFLSINASDHHVSARPFKLHHEIYRYLRSLVLAWYNPRGPTHFDLPSNFQQFLSVLVLNRNLNAMGSVRLIPRNLKCSRNRRMLVNRKT